MSNAPICLAEIKRALRDAADPEKAVLCQRFFKTGKGEYGEGDRFLGITIPVQRKIAARFRALPAPDVLRLLRSPFHEDRFTALMLFVHRYAQGDEAERETVFRTYLAETAFINSWDLVDCSAPNIVGQHLRSRPRTPLDKLAKSRALWERRIAMVSTLAFIRNGDLADAFRVAEILLNDRHDLIHKAVGWMLREAGKRDRQTLNAFLARHAAMMPRTMLRYAIEKHPKRERRAYLRIKS